VATYDLHPEVADAHLALDVDDWDAIYVVGDVHGCLRPLEALLEELAVTPDDLVVFVGDLLRKGPDSAAVLDLVRSRENLFTVRGNNEEKVIRGEATLPGLDAGDVDYLLSLPVAITVGETLVVHGGVDPRKPLAEHTVDDLQNTRSLAPEGGYRSPFWYERHEGPPRVCFGHTVLERPVERRWAVGLDAGCVYGGRLTAYDLRNRTFRSVRGRRDGVARSGSKIVSVEGAPRSDG
jgi:serine/threonine protein phosphatase 1